MTTLPAELQSIQDRLLGLGVDPAACEAYTFLLHAGPARAAEVATGMKISRDEAYRRLNLIVEHGFAAATLTRPLRYLPTPPTEVVQNIYRRSTREAENVARVRRHLEPMLEGLRAAGDAATGLPFRPVNGREKAFDVMHELINDARDSVVVLSSHAAFAHVAMQAGVWSHLKQRSGAGVKVRLLLSDSPATKRHAPRLAESGWPLRLLTTEHGVQFVIADDRLLFFAALDASPWLGANDIAVVTSAPGLVDLQRLLFERLWGEASPP